MCDVDNDDKSTEHIMELLSTPLWFWYRAAYMITNILKLKFIDVSVFYIEWIKPSNSVRQNIYVWIIIIIILNCFGMEVANANETKSLPWRVILLHSRTAQLNFKVLSNVEFEQFIYAHVKDFIIFNLHLFYGFLNTVDQWQNNWKHNTWIERNNTYR